MLSTEDVMVVVSLDVRCGTNGYIKAVNAVRRRTLVQIHHVDLLFDNIHES
jgi:hypothetical protein